jgi:hypothetical protein
MPAFWGAEGLDPVYLGRNCSTDQEYLPITIG